MPVSRLTISVLLLLAAVGLAAFWGAQALRQNSRDGGPALAQASAEDDFERRVRAYLLENPEVIVEAMEVLERRRQAAEIEELHTVLAARHDEIFRDPQSPVGGNPQGDVTLVEFFDYNCPYCRRVAGVMQQAAEADPNLRLVYKEFPILGPGSHVAARAALAAARQGRYVAYHAALMRASGSLGESEALEIAQTVGIDVERLRADMADPALGEAVERNLELAHALRITGTPSFVVGDQIIRGATDLETMQKAIAAARREASTRDVAPDAHRPAEKPGAVAP